jgi:hypothetical protein
VDSGRRQPRGSPELDLTTVSRRKNSPWQHQIGAGAVAVLIRVSYGQLDGESRSAAKRSKLWCWSSVLGDQGHGEVEKMVAQGAVSRCGLGGAFYRLWEAV